MVDVVVVNVVEVTGLVGVLKTVSFPGCVGVCLKVDEDLLAPLESLFDDAAPGMGVGVRACVPLVLVEASSLTLAVMLFCSSSPSLLSGTAHTHTHMVTETNH